MTCATLQLSADVLKVVVSALGGGIVGALVTYLSRRTDKQNRKREFRSFLAGWRADVVQCGPSITANNFPPKIANFEREVERVRPDYGDEFQQLASKVSNFPPGDITGGEWDKFKQAIKELEEFAKKN